MFFLLPAKFKSYWSLSTMTTEVLPICLWRSSGPNERKAAGSGAVQQEEKAVVFPMNLDTKEGQLREQEGRDTREVK